MTAPGELPADVADLLGGTLGPGGLPGVLADWVDERSAAWAPLTAALRAARPATVPAGACAFEGPRYLMLAADVMAWVTSFCTYDSETHKQSRRVTVLGFHRTTPGREAVWKLRVDRDRKPLRLLFGLPGRP